MVQQCTRAMFLHDGQLIHVKLVLDICKKVFAKYFEYLSCWENTDQPVDHKQADLSMLASKRWIIGLFL